MSDIVFNSGDRVVVINSQYNNKTGVFLKQCSIVFKEHCHVKLDLEGRQREHKTIMVLIKDIKHEQITD